MFTVFVFSGCSWADNIEEGTYVCKTPYIKFTYDLDVNYNITQEIETDRKVYEAFSQVGYDGTIEFIEYQKDDVQPISGLYYGDNKTYARFDYKFDNNKKQLILTDQKTGNRYYLDKVE